MELLKNIKINDLKFIVKFSVIFEFFIVIFIFLIKLLKNYSENKDIFLQNI